MVVLMVVMRAEWWVELMGVMKVELLVAMTVAHLVVPMAEK